MWYLREILSMFFMNHIHGPQHLSFLHFSQNAKSFSCSASSKPYLLFHISHINGRFFLIWLYGGGGKVICVFSTPENINVWYITRLDFLFEILTQIWRSCPLYLENGHLENGTVWNNIGNYVRGNFYILSITTRTYSATLKVELSIRKFNFQFLKTST